MINTLTALFDAMARRAGQSIIVQVQWNERVLTVSWDKVEPDESEAAQFRDAIPFVSADNNIRVNVYPEERRVTYTFTRTTEEIDLAMHDFVRSMDGHVSSPEPITH